MAATDWISKYPELLDGGSVRCPECGTGTVEARFVGDQITRMGYAVLFCAECRRKVHLSRVKVPSAEKLVPFEEAESLSAIDDFELVE